MFKNYLKSAIRNSLKHKVITFITILGLSIGISAALVIYQIVHYDFSFDQYEPDRNRIYRIVSEGPNWKNSGSPAPLHQAVQNIIAGITTVAPFFEYNWNTKVSIPQNQKMQPREFKKQENIVFTDGNYFNIFPHQWLFGRATTSFNAPNQVVLSESRAKRYFPDMALSEIMGKQLTFNDTINTVVSGIVGDLNEITDFDNQVFISLPTITHGGLKQFFNWDQWGSISDISQLFVKLAPGVSVQQVNNQLTNIFKAHLKENYTDKEKHFLQPLSDIHFSQNFYGPADRSVLRNLILLAVFLLLLGAINFINLSTAQASLRAKEIGVRKTLGSTKGQLIAQFLTETFLLTFLATVISLLILPFLFNIFSGYIPEGLEYEGIRQPQMFIFLFLLVVVVSLLSGIYPALILTRFKPASAMKNIASSHTGQTRGSLVRKTLIVSQFIIAQVFIISVLSVNRQIRYAVNKDMGFKKEAIINFQVPMDFYHPDRKGYILRNKLRTLPEIDAVSLGDQSPAFSGTIATSVTYQEGKDKMTLHPDLRNGDTAYLRLYDIQLLAGRNVRPADSATELLINATMARQLGFQHPQDALGKLLKYQGREMPIVGVMADFNESSVRRAIQPMIYCAELRYGYIMHVALQANSQAWQKAIGKIKKNWQSVYPDKDFEYTFLDQTIESFYKQDVKLSKLLSWLAGIAIFIGCMGLLGLVIFMANQRTKEIGIRKVLGASVTQIVTLLSKDFILLVAVAFIIAVPIAWIFMKKWLRNFAYHTSLSWWVFVASGVIMLLIALAILSIRAVRAARANPVESLRAE